MKAKAHERPHAPTPSRQGKRWSPEEKRAIVMETYSPEEGLSSIGRKYGISPSSIFDWVKRMEEGAIVGVSSKGRPTSSVKVRDMERWINRLEKLLPRRTEEVEILKEAVRLGREKELISLKF